MFPDPLNPELIMAGMRCGICDAEQGVSLSQEDGAVILSTSLPR